MESVSCHGCILYHYTLRELPELNGPFNPLLVQCIFILSVLTLSDKVYPGMYVCMYIYI